MTYKTEMEICADLILSGAWDAGWTLEDFGDYELTAADIELCNGEQCDSPASLPFADESVQRAFTKDVQERVNELARIEEWGEA
jgi:hypothetical protein